MLKKRKSRESFVINQIEKLWDEKKLKLLACIMSCSKIIYFIMIVQPQKHYLINQKFEYVELLRKLTWWSSFMIST